MIVIFYMCFVCYKFSNFANMRHTVCLHFYKNLLQNQNYTKLLSSSSTEEDLYNQETCLHGGEIAKDISKAVMVTIRSCMETTDEFVCTAVKNFALPFHNLCKKCSNEEMDLLSPLFIYLCGATTVGYGSALEYWLPSHISSNIDLLFLVSAFTSFVGIILIAIMESYQMLNYLAILKPRMWAEHNITYLERILRSASTNDKIVDMVHNNEADKMCQQLYLTFLECKASGTRSNHKIIKEMLHVFPDFYTMPVNEVFNHIALSSILDVSQVQSLVSYGTTVAVTPEYNFYFSQDILRDILVIIDGYVNYDSLQRGNFLCRGSNL